MPKTPLSPMTAQEFVETMAALGLKYNQLAKALGKSKPLVSLYASGQQRIPITVANSLTDLLRAERDRLKARDNRLANHELTISSMIVLQNEQRIEARRRGNPEPHSTEGRLLRRQREPDTQVYPAYRMNRERMKTYVEALARWQDRIRELAREYTDATRQRDYQLELRDIHLLADTAPRSAPYDVLIERSQWDVVSRALRHLASTNAKAHALRAHWSKHKGSGYPKHRPTATASSTRQLPEVS